MITHPSLWTVKLSCFLFTHLGCHHIRENSYEGSETYAFFELISELIKFYQEP